MADLNSIFSPNVTPQLASQMAMMANRGAPGQNAGSGGIDLSTLLKLHAAQGGGNDIGSLLSGGAGAASSLLKIFGIGGGGGGSAAAGAGGAAAAAGATDLGAAGFSEVLPLFAAAI